MSRLTALAAEWLRARTLYRKNWLSPTTSQTCSEYSV
jgi:hypothetical protein